MRENANDKKGWVRMNTMYESRIGNARWIAYDLPGNAGWIIWIVCLAQLLWRGADWFALLALLPALLMLVGIGELVSERVQRLDRVLTKARLYRGFGALALGGLLGIGVSAAGLIAAQGTLCWWMLGGAALCALFAWLIFREYHPRSE